MKNLIVIVTAVLGLMNSAYAMNEDCYQAHAVQKSYLVKSLKAGSENLKCLSRKEAKAILGELNLSEGGYEADYFFNSREMKIRIDGHDITVPEESLIFTSFYFGEVISETMVNIIPSTYRKSIQAPAFAYMKTLNASLESKNDGLFNLELAPLDLAKPNELSIVGWGLNQYRVKQSVYKISGRGWDASADLALSNLFFQKRKPATIQLMSGESVISVEGATLRIHSPGENPTYHHYRDQDGEVECKTCTVDRTRNP